MPADHRSTTTETISGWPERTGLSLFPQDPTACPTSHHTSPTRSTPESTRGVLSQDQQTSRP